ncbi:fucose synthetase [Synechococcus sp. CS-197]|nr:fucose synthetase [Synechococcus sp. CS-197]
MALLNMSTGIIPSSCELAELVAATVRFPGEIHWDTSKPDGTPKKQLDVSRLATMGWRARISLNEGLQSTYECFKSSDAIQR